MGDVLVAEVFRKAKITGLKRFQLHLDEGTLVELKGNKQKKAMNMMGTQVKVGQEKNQMIILKDKKEHVYNFDEDSDFHDWMEAVRLASKCSFFDAYSISDKLGEGAYGEVFVCTENSTNRKFAVKTIRKENPKLSETACNELEMVKTIRNQNLVHTYETHETHSTVYFVMELMHGELMKHLMAHKYYTEDQTRVVLDHVLSGLIYLHSRNIIHRDVKLENMLLESEPDMEKNKFLVKLSDFGLCLSKNKDLPQTPNEEPVGTGYYMAPEMLRSQQYTRASDMWALGVSTYIMLSGGYPFTGDTEVDYFKNLLRCQYTFDGPRWEHVSDSAKDFVSRLLVADSSKRMTAKEAVVHEWVLKFKSQQHEAAGGIINQARKKGSMVLRNMSSRRDRKRGDITSSGGIHSPLSPNKAAHLSINSGIRISPIVSDDENVNNSN